MDHPSGAGHHDLSLSFLGRDHSREDVLLQYDASSEQQREADGQSNDEAGDRDLPSGAPQNDQHEKDNRDGSDN